MLPDHVERLAALGVNHVTVTVNAIDPAVAERIYPWIFFDGERLDGRAAARTLIRRQLQGIALLRDHGLLCKVNSVLVPGVNDRHLPAVSRAVRSLGAFVHNVMPLVSAPEHGTHYGLTGQRGPTAAELESVQKACAGNAAVMRHCRQCRADAVGRLGEDRHAEFELSNLRAEVPDAPGARGAWRLAADVRRAQLAAARDQAIQAAAGLPADLSRRVAVATKGDGLVNQHFGHAREFLVYDVGREGARLAGVRKVEQYCRGGEGEEPVLDAVLRALSDCAAVLVAKVGRCPKESLAAAGIEPVDRFAHRPIESSAVRWLADCAGMASDRKAG
jgi:nitrogen fixation protein NifB